MRDSLEKILRKKLAQHGRLVNAYKNTSISRSPEGICERLAREQQRKKLDFEARRELLATSIGWTKTKLPEGIETLLQGLGDTAKPYVGVNFTRLTPFWANGKDSVAMQMLNQSQG